MGRPVSYDEAAVVNAALDQFWTTGFRASSVDMLVDCTGLNKHSLYQTFGGKSGLFARVLERYIADYSQTFLTIFDNQRGLGALRKYFRAVTAKTDTRGCFVVNAAVELGDSDPDCHRLIADYYQRLTDCFAQAIAAGQQDGEIRAELEPRSTAAWLVSAVQGMAVNSRLGAAQRALPKSILAMLVGAEASRGTANKKYSGKNSVVVTHGYRQPQPSIRKTR